MLYTKEIAVAVDLSSNDKTVLQYTKYLATKLNVEKVNLVHVIPSILSPENLDVKIDQLIGVDFNLKGKIKDRLQAIAQPIFNNGISAQVDVIEGNPYRELMAYVEDLDSDLLVVGVKSDSERSGITAQRVVRNFKGYVLFVPDNVAMGITRISVPIDFSDNSARALKIALSLSKKIKNCTVRCIHAINSIPDKYYLDMKMKNSLNHQLLSFAENAWAIFLEKNDLQKENIHIDYRQEINSTAGKILQDYFERQNTDMVVMGAKGHTAFEKFLYGSVTEALVDTCTKRSILVIR